MLDGGRPSYSLPALPLVATIYTAVDFDKCGPNNYRKRCGGAGRWAEQVWARIPVVRSRRLPFGGLFASFELTKRGLTVLMIAEYAGGFVKQYNLLWRKEFRSGQSSGALLWQCGSGDFTSP